VTDPTLGTTPEARRELRAALVVAGLAASFLVTRVAFWMWNQVGVGDITRTGFALSAIGLYLGALYCLLTSPRLRPFGIGLAAGWAAELAWWVWIFVALSGAGLE
jgi:hypothetical protein